MTADTNESWGKILELIEGTIKIPRSIIELIAVKDILTLCASGVCNHKIATVLDVDHFYVKSVLIEFIDFAGWSQDLDLNPYSIYANIRANGYGFQEFKNEIFALSPYMNDELAIHNAFIICQKLYSIEKKIEEEWK